MKDIIAWSKKWRDEHKEHIKEYNSRYYREHRKEILEKKDNKEYTRVWRIKNADKVKRYSELHKEDKACRESKRRARKKGNGGSHTPEEWNDVLVHYGSRCLRCGATERIEKDHVVSIKNNGSDDIENLQPLCRSCNTSKNSKTVDYRPDKGLYAKTRKEKRNDRQNNGEQS